MSAEPTREELLVENARLREALLDKAGKINLREFYVKDGMATFGLEGGAAHLLADTFAHQFKENGAANYLEMSFVNDEVGELTVTMQRRQGKTPHQLRALAEAQRDRYRAALDRLRTLLDEHPTSVIKDTPATRLDPDAAAFFNRAISEVHYAIRDVEAMQKELGA